MSSTRKTVERASGRPWLEPFAISLARALAGAGFLLVLAAPARPQVPGAVPGQWVRIHSAGGRWEGALVSRDADSLRFTQRAGSGRQVDTAAIAMALVGELWVRRRGSRQTLRGMGLGLLAGAAVGGVLGLGSYRPCESGGFDCIMAPKSRGESFGVGATAGGSVGLLIGGIAGFASRRHRWERIPLQPTLGPVPHGAGRLALSLELKL